jgi:transcriptional regulator with XRE-family HTH domain
MQEEPKQDRFLTLKGARINAGLTLEQAANKLGISKYILSNYENSRSQVTLSVAWRMKAVYKLRSVEELNPEKQEKCV